MWVGWRINYWLGPQHPKIFRLHRHGQNVLRLIGSPIESRQFAADHYVRIEWVGDDVTVFLRRDRLPIAEGNLAFISPALNSNRTAFLLSAVKRGPNPVIPAHVIQLRRRLVIPGTPRLAPVHGNDRALVGTEQNDLGVVRIDP